MTPKKFLIPFVLVSIAGHALVLALTNGVDWSAGPREEEVMTVELRTPPETKGRPESPKRTTSTEAPGVGLQREDSVALQDQNSRYDAYLMAIRRKIEYLWIYPPQALAEGKEGETQIRFTINANGALSEYRIVTTSGSPVLDKGALAVVRDSAPYAPLPADFNLARLHITAVFSYRLNP
jgi:TonB family protein